VLVSPHRTQRPWQGQVEAVAAAQQPQYDPECYLCPGNARAGGHRNPEYKQIFVFVNDFSALLPLQTAQPFQVDECGLLVAASEAGVCRVMCFSPRHDLTLATMPICEIRTVIDEWAMQYEELGKLDWINHVQIFENRGAMMGASNPHPHCQIWANQSLPNEPAKELRAQRAYLEKHQACLLCNYLKVESEAQERMVYENEYFAVMVPFWAIWPFEVMVIVKQHVQGLDELTPEQRNGLAKALKNITSAFDRIFEAAFPYSMGFHQAPTDKQQHPEWHLHAHFYPPLLRSATVRKFMVGYELLGSPQRDITAESAAARLREFVNQVQS
jgi:UDPglucose--hexose-1-phosphate uridylyltransferase